MNEIDRIATGVPEDPAAPLAGYGHSYVDVWVQAQQTDEGVRIGDLAQPPA